MILSLRTKGLIFVAAFICSQLLIIVAFWCMLDQAQQEAQREKHAREVVDNLHSFINGMYKAGKALKTVEQLRDPQRLAEFDESSRDVRRSIAWLSENVDPQNQPYVAKVKDDLDYALKNLRELREKLAHPEEMQLQDIRMVTRRYQALTPWLQSHDGIIEHFLALAEHAKERSDQLNTQEEWRNRLRIIIVLFLLAFLGFTFAGTHFFLTSITSRLGVLTDNTYRLASGVELNPRLIGDDEIVRLDNTFHEMAEALEDAARKRKAWVAMISHDLRTPLTGIQGYFECLTMGVFGDISETARMKAEAAEKSVGRLIRLINDLLELERIESGGMELVKEPLTAADLLQSTLDSVQNYAEEHGVELIVESPDLEIVADSDRIVRVLVNLVGNAVKFSPKGGTVTMTARGLPNYIEFRIIDRGRGVPANMRQRIFDQFAQVDESDNRKKGGTGLGLAICKAIVEQHGGSIGVDSEEGKGSQFWFRLPATQSPTPVAAHSS